MNYLRALLLTTVVLVFAIGAVADGTDIHIVFDPGPSTFVDPTNIYQQGVAYSVAWTSCSETGIPPSLSGETACLAMNNLSGGPISDLDVSFVVPSGSPLVGQTVTCDNTDSYLTTNNCSAAGTLTANELVDLGFSGGTSIPNNTDFFIGADAAGLSSPSDFPPVTVADAPEPGVLLLLSTGLGILGLGWATRRKDAPAGA